MFKILRYVGMTSPEDLSTIPIKKQNEFTSWAGPSEWDILDSWMTWFDKQQTSAILTERPDGQRCIFKKMHHLDHKELQAPYKKPESFPLIE